MVQWLRLCASNVGGVGLIPDQGTKISDAVGHGQKKKGKKKKIHGVNEEVSREIKKYIELNENENTTYQNLWGTAKAKLRE